MIKYNKEMKQLRTQLVQKDLEVKTIKDNLEKEIFNRAVEVLQKKIELEKLENFIKNQNDLYLGMKA